MLCDVMKYVIFKVFEGDCACDRMIVETVGVVAGAMSECVSNSLVDEIKKSHHIDSINVD